MFQATQQAHQKYEKQNPQQRYIPGMNQAPPNKATPVVGSLGQVSDILLNEFKTKSKNPAQCLHEYASQMKVKLVFHDVELIYNPKFPLAIFAVQAEINGRKFPQGVGNTKKEAKYYAAKIAFKIAVLGQGDNDASAPSEQQSFNVEACQVPNNQEKHPVMRLYELMASHGRSCEVIVGDDRGPMGFKACVMVDNEYFAEGVAGNKKEAKRLAGIAALKKLNLTVTSKPAPVEKSLGQKITDLVYQQLYMYLEQYPDLRDKEKSIAAVVQMINNDMQVVALATGNGCIPSTLLTTDGRCVIDSHAAVIARRTFRRYLTIELQNYMRQPNSPNCIFYLPPNEKMLSIKKNVTFHLFISEPPTGDYEIFHKDSSRLLTHEDHEMIAMGAHKPAFEMEDHGALSTTSEEGKTVHIIENEEVFEPLTDFISSRHLSVMSVSDKILKWNVLGIQGAAFSSVFNPVYLSSITLGKTFDHGHLSRAVCCRLYEELNAALPDPYHVNHPQLNEAFIPSFHDHKENGLNNLSVNWAKGQESIEIINSSTGRIIPESPAKTGSRMASRLCKAAVLFRFRQHCQESHLNDFIPDLTYGEYKMASVVYQAAKKLFYKHCIEAQIGGWVHKPQEVDLFTE